MKLNYSRVLNEVNYTESDRTIIVLGCGRGGTSALAGGIRQLGVFMPYAHPLKHEWSPIDTDQPFEREHFRTSIDGINRQYPVWGWKSPKDVFVAEAFLPILRNPVVLIVVRNPLNISESMLKYDGIEIEVGFEEVVKAYEGIQNFISHTYHPVSLVSYEDLLENASGYFKEINDWIGLKANGESLKRAADFITNGMGYRSVIGDVGEHVFAADELEKDRINAQTRLYPPLIARLAQNISVIERDIISVKLQIKHYQDMIFNLSKQRGEDIGLEIDLNLIYQLSNIDIEEFCNILKLTSDEEKITTDNTNGEIPPIAELSHDEHRGLASRRVAYSLSSRLYLQNKQRFLDLRIERQQIQYRIDDLIRREKRLLDCNELSLRGSVVLAAEEAAADALSDSAGDYKAREQGAS